MQTKMCTEILLTAALLLSVSYYQSIYAVNLSNSNALGNSSQPLNNTPSGPFQVTADKLPGCTTIGQYEEPQPTARAAWATFKEHMDNYRDFHHKQLQKLKSGDNSIRTLT